MIKVLGYKSIQVIVGISCDLFKYFKDQITDILISLLIFASNFKTIPFCKPSVFVNDTYRVVEDF